MNKNNPSKKSVRKDEKLSFGLLFDEYKGVAHLEALEMLSRQSSVKLEMLSLQNSTQNTDTKSKLQVLTELFDAEKLNNDEDDENNDDSSLFTFDFKILVNSKDQLFDIEHFEFLINDYARKSHLKLIIDKVIGSFRTTSLASREILLPMELVNYLA